MGYPQGRGFSSRILNAYGSAKRRAPAWTDRILWRKDRTQPSTRNDVARQPTIKLMHYDSCMDMLLSDHKPVYAHMEIKVRVHIYSALIHSFL